MVSSNRLLDELWREEIRFARQIDPVRRLQCAGELFDELCERMRAGIRHEFPGASDQRVREILFERFEVARRLEQRS